MGMNACGLPEFLAEILIELIKFWLIMCGILEFRISKSKKRYISALSVLLIVVFALYVIEFMNPLSLGTLSTLLFGIVITGKKKILWTILSFFTICTVDELCIYTYCRFFLSGDKPEESILNSFGIIVFSLIVLVKYVLFRKKIKNPVTICWIVPNLLCLLFFRCL